MIYYPLSVLMQAKIKDILIITKQNDQPLYKSLLGDGSHLGLNIEYKIQKKPNGLAEAFIIGEDFIGNESVCLILGDNVFHGFDFSRLIRDVMSKRKKGATIFGYKVSDPERFGVANLDKNHKVISIEEKPKNPKSNYAVVGLYMYESDVVNIAKKITPSTRGELEISDINSIYLEKNKLNIEILSPGFAWLDTGTHEALSDASTYVRTIEKRQGIKVGCIEEIAYKNSWISKKQLKAIAKNLCGTEYSDYLLKISK